MTNSSRLERNREFGRKFVGYIQMRFARVLFSLGFLVLLVELAGIWKEVHQIRVEQVKSRWYALPEQTRAQISKGLPKTEQRKREFESTANANVEGSVEIENQPIEVETDQ